MAHPNVVIGSEPEKDKLNGICCIKHCYVANDHGVQDRVAGNFILSVSSQPIDGDFAFSVNGVDYFFSSNPTEYNQVEIGATVADTEFNVFESLESVRGVCKNFTLVPAPNGIFFISNTSGIISGLSYNFNPDVFNTVTLTEAKNAVFQDNYVVGFCVQYDNGSGWKEMEDEIFNDVNSDSEVCFTPDLECIMNEVCPDNFAPLFDFKPALRYRIGKVNRYGNPIQDYIFDKPENNEIFYASDTCCDVNDCGKLTLLNSLPAKICGNDFFLNWFIPDFGGEGFIFSNLVTLIFSDGTSLAINSGDIVGSGAGTICQKIPLSSLNCPILLDGSKISDIDSLSLEEGSSISGNAIILQQSPFVTNSEFCFDLPLMSGGEYQLSFTVKNYLKDINLPDPLCGISVFLVDNLGNELLVSCVNGNQSYVATIDLTNKPNFCEKIVFRLAGDSSAVSAEFCDIMLTGANGGGVEITDIEILPTLDIGGVGVDADSFIIDVEDDCCNCSTAFVFKNKWGKLESFHVPCATGGTKNVEFEEVKKCGDCKEVNEERLVDSSDVLTHVFDLNTSANDLFCQFLESENKWIFTDGKYRSIRGISGSFPYFNKTDSKIQVSFSYEIGDEVVKNQSSSNG